MTDLFKHIFDFIFLKTKKNWVKLFYVLTIIILLLLVDDYYGFSKNYFINGKLDQLEKLKSITPETFSTDSLIQNEILSIKKNIFNKTTFVEKSRNVINNQFEGIITWRNFWACFSVLFGMLYVPFITFKEKGSFWKKITITLILEIVLFIVAFILIKILGLIPQFKYFWLNDIVNYLLQLFLWLTIVFALQPGKQNNSKSLN